MFRQGDGLLKACDEGEVAEDKRWDEDGNILIGAHLPEWVCLKPLDAGSVCPLKLRFFFVWACFLFDGNGFFLANGNTGKQPER